MHKRKRRRRRAWAPILTRQTGVSLQEKYLFRQSIYVWNSSDCHRIMSCTVVQCSSQAILTIKRKKKKTKRRICGTYLYLLFPFLDKFFFFKLHFPSRFKLQTFENSDEGTLWIKRHPNICEQSCNFVTCNYLHTHTFVRPSYMYNLGEIGWHNLPSPYLTHQVSKTVNIRVPNSVFCFVV